ASLRDQGSGVFQYQLSCRIPTLALDIQRQGVGSAAGLVQQIGCAHDELEALRFAERLSRSILQKGAEQGVILITDFFPALSIGEQMLPVEVLEYLSRLRVTADRFRQFHRHAAHKGCVRQDIADLRGRLIENLARKVVE